jgi:predicted ATPase
LKTPLESFIKAITLKRDTIPSKKSYPFSIPSIAKLSTLKLHPKVTFFVGENGSGKSTLLEALAVKLGFNPEGGSKNFSFNTRASHSILSNHIDIDRGSNLRKPKDGFFFRAESYFNLATEIEKLDEPDTTPWRNITVPKIIDSFGKKSLHEQSHGESFFALLANRFHPDGVYLLDEPEAALSPARQLSCLTLLHLLVQNGSQFVIATHSPILMAYPAATIYHFSERGVKAQAYDETEHFVVTRDFLTRKDKMLKILLEDETDQA